MHLNANNAWMRPIPFKNAIQSCLFLVSAPVIDINDLRFLLIFTCDVFYDINIVTVEYFGDYIALPDYFTIF